MPEFLKFYDTIDDIVEHCRIDFIGPVEKDEVITIEDPLSRYSLGILWARSQNRGSQTIEINNSLGELFEDDSEEGEELRNFSIFKPSSMGISVVVAQHGNLEITFTYGIYHHSEQMVEMNGKPVNQHSYKREAKKFTAVVSVPDKIGHMVLAKEEKEIEIYLHVRKINPDNSKLVTVSVFNKQTTVNEFVENNTKALFQCQLSLKSEKGFLPVYQRNIHRSLEEEKNDMLYDGVNNYSYGHGCSSVLDKDEEESGIIQTIRSEFIPQYRMLQMMPRILDGAKYLYMQYWKDIDRETACRSLYDFISEYQKWFEALKANETQLVARYPEPARQAFANIERCIARLQDGVRVLQEHDTAWKAFQYMNEAMLLQRHKVKETPPDQIRWYPFQMAYILQIIPDIVNPASAYHEKVDLLWFPTGGGKTEAYLGLSAFTIFYRRLHGDSHSDGVTVLMRYTLRLLTLQQFERATALICACEYMRRNYHFSEKEISIGLWIGSGMTPNHIKNAVETLNKLKEDSSAVIYEANPMQITKCPWCRTEIGIKGYEIKDNRMNISCCDNPNCAFHHHLPIYVVDDDIYECSPTFVLSTVDKFARITWEEKAGNLLGGNGCPPPDLIIQDELHLISGPLGSITGIYEMAIDEICRHYGKAPKIIASTATVKNADKQIKILYDRDMIQFPPNGLSQKDSFFAVEASKEERPARTYVGICSIGTGTSEMLIKIFALLTFMKYLYIKQGKPTKVIDQYYTFVGYFNSLKELGSNSNMIYDRILSEIKYLVTHKFRKEAEQYHLTADGKKADIPSYFKNNELTSRNSAKEIKMVLERLTREFTDDSCFDYIMASNMLSVGIDIDRLGVMCMYGQPKSNSEYIQATSRVGRTNPGLVITLYNGMRSRDKSYYEQFNYYHSTFYKYVESTSVTSYSPRAIEKALHCAMMAIIRHTIPRYNPNESACQYQCNDSDIAKVKQNMLKRIDDIEPHIVWYAEEWLDYYLQCWQEMADTLPDSLVFYNYQNEDVALFRSADSQNGSKIPTILNSVRNVETSSGIYFTKR